jgi:hypothetical protein
MSPRTVCGDRRWRKQRRHVFSEMFEYKRIRLWLKLA